MPSSLGRAPTAGTPQPDLRPARFDRWRRIAGSTSLCLEPPASSVGWLRPTWPSTRRTACAWGWRAAPRRSLAGCVRAFRSARGSGRSFWPAQATPGRSPRWRATLAWSPRRSAHTAAKASGSWRLASTPGLTMPTLRVKCCSCTRASSATRGQRPAALASSIPVGLTRSRLISASTFCTKARGRMAPAISRRRRSWSAGCAGG